MTTNKILKCAAAFSVAYTAFTAAVFAQDFSKGSITVVQPWTRATPLHAKVGGAYARIVNKGTEDDALVSITSAVSEKIQVHKMVVENNVMKMSELTSPLKIPAHGEVELKPGGYHIMFMGLKDGFEAGKPFEAVLHFQKAGDVKVTFDVEPVGATKPAQAA